jgi:hypothetical protein
MVLLVSSWDCSSLPEESFQRYSFNRHENGTPYRHPKGTPFVAVFEAIDVSLFG